MPTFIMLTRLNPEAVRSPRELEQLERDAMKRVREECPNVEWLNSYAVLGPCDYLDVFITNDIEIAARVSALIRTFGHAQTEIWTAAGWAVRATLHCFGSSIRIAAISSASYQTSAPGPLCGGSLRRFAPIPISLCRPCRHSGSFPGSHGATINRFGGRDIPP
jgi:GYD domain